MTAATRLGDARARAAGSATSELVAAARLPRRWVRASVLQHGVWLVTVVLVLGPVVPIVWASLWSEPLYRSGGSFTLAHYRDLLADTEWWSAVRSSLVFAGLTTAGALTAGTLLALTLERTNVPGRRVFRNLVLLPVALPGLVLIIGWTSMWAPFGYATQWVEDHTPIPVPFDLYSVSGMAMVATSVIGPIVMLYLRSALASIDPSLEQAARTAGAAPARVLRTVTLPLLRPALLNSGVIVFAISLEMLGLPLILGGAANVHLISNYLYDHWISAAVPDEGLVAAGAVLLLATVTLLLFVRNRLVGDAARFVTTTGKPKAATTIDLGPWRWFASGAVVLWITVTLAVPIGGVVLTAFTELLTPFIDPWTVLTTEHFRAVFDNPTYTRAIRNSIMIATLGGLLATFAIAVITMVAHRSSFRWRGSLQHVVMYPRAMPGLVTGMAFFWAYVVLDPTGTMLSSLWALGLAFAVRSLALGYSAMYPALTALGEDLDRAARVAGANWWTTMRTLILRLMLPAMGGAFVLLFVAMLNDYDPAMFMATPRTQVTGYVMMQLSLTGIAGPVAALGVIQMAITFTVLGLGRLVVGARPHA